MFIPSHHHNLFYRSYIEVKSINHLEDLVLTIYLYYTVPSIYTLLLGLPLDLSTPYYGLFRFKRLFYQGTDKSVCRASPHSGLGKQSLHIYYYYYYCSCQKYIMQNDLNHFIISKVQNTFNKQIPTWLNA